MAILTTDTTQELVIFPKTISVGLILGCLALAALGFTVLPLGWSDGNWTVVAAGLFLGPLGLALVIALIVKRSKGVPGPTMTLAPDGLRMHLGAIGLVPWRDVQRLGNFSVKGTTMLLVHITPEAMARLHQSKFIKASRKVDTAVGLSALTFHQQNLEIPMADFVQLLHDYSIAHGGPALQPAP